MEAEAYIARNLIWVGRPINCTISNLSWVKETKQPHKKFKVDWFGGIYIYGYTPRRYAPAWKPNNYTEYMHTRRNKTSQHHHALLKAEYCPRVAAASCTPMRPSPLGYNLEILWMSSGCQETCSSKISSSWVQRFMSYREYREKKTRKKTIQSVATARTVTIKEKNLN